MVNLSTLDHSLFERTGLTLGPSQVWRGIRIVPLLKNRLTRDLRLIGRRHDEPFAAVTLSGAAIDKPKELYCSYVPHAMIVRWADDGYPVATYGTQLDKPDGKRLGHGVRLHHRMAKRQGKHQLRLLPLHLAMEGMLAAHFGGPDIAWQEYSERVLRFGLTPRVESAVPGRAIIGLDGALRTFEMHETQVGCIVYVADAIASIFIVPHPDDYRRLHRTLLLDFYGELLWHYSRRYDRVSQTGPRIDATTVNSLADIVAGVEQMRREWRAFHKLAGDGMLSAPLHSEPLNKLGAFRLLRFRTSLRLNEDNHIGEAIVRAQTGAIEYLKTFRLSAQQTRRAYLLQQLAHHRWNIRAAAASMRDSEAGPVLRLERGGFGYLIAPHVLEQARRRPKKR